MINKNKKIKSHEHYYFICDDCGSVNDVFVHETILQVLVDHVQKLTNSFAKVKRVNLSFQGFCHSCRINKKDSFKSSK